MSDPIVLAGPASPPAMCEWLNDVDHRRALELPGIGGTALANIAKAFLSEGHHVELVTLAPELDEAIVLEGPRLRMLIGPFRPRPRHRCPDAFRQERRHVRSMLATTSGKVINAHWTYEFALGALGLPNRSTVVTAHDAPFTVLRYQRPRTYRAVCTAMALAVRAKSPLLTAVSPYLASSWRRQMIYRSPIAITPNVVPFVETNRAHTDSIRGPIILEVADAGRLKNVACLIHAMPELLVFNPRTRLVLAGRGLTRDSPLASLARRLSVHQHVDFMGRIATNELDQLYRQADVFAHASLEEACPMSVAEAMAHALPIVGGDQSGGVPWLLDEGRAGKLVDVRKPSAIARGIIDLLTDPSLRQRLSAAAQAHVRSHLSQKAVTNAYLEVYARAQST